MGSDSPAQAYRIQNFSSNDVRRSSPPTFSIQPDLEHVHRTPTFEAGLESSSGERLSPSRTIRGARSRGRMTASRTAAITSALMAETEGVDDGPLVKPVKDTEAYSRQRKDNHVC